MKEEMILTHILEVELFDVWGIDFKITFPRYYGTLFILVFVSYVLYLLKKVHICISPH